MAIFGGAINPGVSSGARTANTPIFGRALDYQDYDKAKQEQLEQAALNAQTQQIVPQVEPLVGNASRSPLTQGAYESQAMEALRNQFATQQRESESRDAATRAQSQAAELEKNRMASTAEAEKGRSATSALAQMQVNAARDLAAQQAKAESDFLNQRASLSDASWQNRFSQVQGAMGQPGATTIQHGTAGMQGNETAARAAAFARAKEQAGRTANSALMSLRGLFEDSGTTGSTMEAAQAGNIIGGAGAGVNQFTRDQLMSDLARAAEIEDMQYQGGITQRGQDISAKNALLSLMNAGVLY